MGGVLIMKYVIYKVLNLVNNKIYIGQTKNFDLRKRCHINSSLNKKKKHNMIFHKAIRKYGIEQFEWSIIWQGDQKLLSEMEIYFIKKHNSHHINGFGYNMTNGGEGVLNEDNYNYDKTLYTFYHKDGRIEKDITQLKFREKYDLNSCAITNLIKGKQKSIRDWSLTDKYISNLLDNNKYTFYHTDGRIEENITQKEMNNKYNIQISKVVIGKENSLHGWRITKEQVLHPNIDNTLYNFTHKDFRKKYNLSHPNLCKLLRNECNTIKGWKLLN